MNLTILRDNINSERIYGTLSDDGRLLAQTIELPNRDNAPDVSCCAAGHYTASIRWSNRHQHAVLGIDGVEGRDGLAFDVANFAGQLLGCVGVGQTRGLLGGKDAILSSKLAMDSLMTYVGCPEYEGLTTPELVADFITQHPESQRIPLTITEKP